MVYLLDIYQFAGIYERLSYFYILLPDYMANQFKKYHSKIASEINLFKVF